MSPRDFTDERRRASIPTMNSGGDPASPFCTDLNLISRGPVAQMRVPPGWISGEKVDSGARRYSFRNITAPCGPEVLISFFYRGWKISPASAKRFEEIILEPIHDLTPEELGSLSEVLQDRGDSRFFDLGIARAKTLNGKRVLVIEGYYKHTGEGRLQLFLPASSDARIIQEIIYQAPQSVYREYRKAVCKAFDSIVWRP